MQTRTSKIGTPQAQNRDDEGAVADVRAARRALAARFGYDVHRLCEFLRQQEKARPALSGSPRRAGGKSTRCLGSTSGPFNVRIPP